MRKTLLGLAALIAIGLGYSFAYTPLTPFTVAGGCTEASQLFNCLNQLVASINTNVSPATFASAGLPRNVIDNGAMAVQQRGTGTVTCAQAAGTTATTYGADRWACQANVTSGAGQMAVATATPTPPTDFTAETKLWRNSGALTQPVCSMQEIATANVKPLAGQAMVLSFYAAAMAGLSADNGNVIHAYVFYGTGSDEGLGTPTASPAVTPAWTGIATAFSQDFTITTTYARYTGSFNMPATATEAAVYLCFTPTASGAGSTDGFAFTGVQLERGSAPPSAYEFRKYGDEVREAYRYYYQINETNGAVIANGMISATNVETVVRPLPTPMRAVPAVALTAGGFQFNIAGTPTAVGAGFAAGSVQALGSISIVGAVTATVAQGTQLLGSNTTGKITVSADF